MGRCSYRYIQACDWYRQSDEVEKLTFDSTTPFQRFFLQEAAGRKYSVACWLEVEASCNRMHLSLSPPSRRTLQPAVDPRVTSGRATDWKPFYCNFSRLVVALFTSHSLDRISEPFSEPWKYMDPFCASIITS
jgi:hypothetical protein